MLVVLGATGDRDRTMATGTKYADHEALGPFFDVVREGLGGLVRGEYFYEAIAENAVFEFLYEFPGWPRTLRGRAGVEEGFSGYGNNITLHASRGLVVHRSQDPRVVILEYELRGTVLRTGAPYENRFISVVTIEDGQIVHWRDYMDSLSAWTALTRDP
jgi:ketosteroid isomerase-like protein